MNVNLVSPSVCFMSCWDMPEFGVAPFASRIGEWGSFMCFCGAEKIMKRLNSSVGESPEEGENLAPECGLHVPWLPRKS